MIDLHASVGWGITGSYNGFLPITELMSQLIVTWIIMKKHLDMETYYFHLYCVRNKTSSSKLITTKILNYMTLNTSFYFTSFKCDSLPDGTKPLPEPKVTYHHRCIIHVRAITQEVYMNLICYMYTILH